MLPHTIPNQNTFNKKISELGINNNNNIIIYDSSCGVSAASRAWWMFKQFGHDNVSILDGGFQKWKMEKKPLSNSIKKIVTKNFTAKKDANNFVKNKNDILQNIKKNKFKVVDARSSERFYGKQPEPRDGLRSGHIPKSINFNYSLLINKKSGTFKTKDEIKVLFQKNKISISDEITTSCGSGVTACAIAFGLYLIGKKDTYIYDGSWVEWGSDNNLPIEK